MAKQQKTVPDVVIRPRVKVWIEAHDSHIFCSGMCRILEAVELTGSIKAAATEVGLSYRHVWSRLKECETSLGMPLVESRVGGKGDSRSVLSAPGKSLLRAFTRLREQLNAASDECAQALNAELAPALPRRAPVAGR